MKALSLSAVLAPTLADLLCELMRALTRVGFQGLDQTLRHRTRTIEKPRFEFGNGLGEKLIE